MTATDRIKYAFWRVVVYPVFPFLHDMVLAVRKFLGRDYREPFLAGFLARGTPLERFIFYLRSQGFVPHRIAWRNSGQVLSMRRLNGFRWQYHLRVFKDGEVRVHYEKTPEAHPFDHIRNRGMRSSPDFFLPLLKGWISPLREYARTEQAS